MPMLSYKGIHILWDGEIYDFEINILKKYMILYKFSTFNILSLI